MFRSLKDPDQEPDLGKADRSFALAINGQRFEDISREEAKRLRQSPSDRTRHENLENLDEDFFESAYAEL